MHTRGFLIVFVKYDCVGVPLFVINHARHMAGPVRSKGPLIRSLHDSVVSLKIALEQTAELPMIYGAMALMRHHHCNDVVLFSTKMQTQTKVVNVYFNKTSRGHLIKHVPAWCRALETRLIPLAFTRRSRPMNVIKGLHSNCAVISKFDSQLHHFGKYMPGIISQNPYLDVRYASQINGITFAEPQGILYAISAITIK